MKKSNDIIVFNIGKNAAIDLHSAIASSIKELQFINDKLTNRINYSQEILLVSDQAYLLSNLLKYQEQKMHRLMNYVDVNYADKPTAIELFKHYEKLGKRYHKYAVSINFKAKHCIDSEKI